ncbi:GNAT family N-acetyltransferase [Photobacterium leiognathi]|uniref:GNAT family N-acetyltransferase n=1 Tax=Photobacterium leiognathi TaxID=553611 RepID=UPI0029826D0D|nr:GNAT family N-acetyltransferase [Photobacterium leiognathi]
MKEKLVKVELDKDNFNKNIISFIMLHSDTFNVSENNSFDILSWKYLDNCYGEELGSCFFYENKVVSMRLFTSWKMSYNGTYFNCLQPSDSATAKEHKGQGLFGELTKDCINNLEYDFLFNFPNENSISIYLKLGFYLIKKIKPSVAFVGFPFFFSKRKLHSPLCFDDLEFISSSVYEDVLSSCWDTTSLNWRFLNNPSNTYFFYKNKSVFVVYKLVSSKSWLIDVMLTSYHFSMSDYINFTTYLKTRGVVFIRYFGINTAFLNIISKNMFSFKYGTELNVVSFSKIDDDILKEKLRIELSDTDFA